MPCTLPTTVVTEDKPSRSTALPLLSGQRLLRITLPVFTFLTLILGPAPRAQEAAPPPPGEAPAEAGGGAATSAGEASINLAFSGAPIERVLDSIARQSGRTVVARGKAAGRPISIIARGETFESALNKVVNSQPDLLIYRPEDQPGTVEIWDQATYRQEVLPKLVRQKVFVPRNITAEEASKAIAGILTPNIGAVAFDARSNKVIVTDQPYVLEIAQRLLEQIDVDFNTRVFYIVHADVNEIAEKIAALKSPAAPAPDVDVRTHQIIVRDRLENIRKMELLVNTLDRGPDIRVYDLNNIGIEGEDATSLQEALERIITPEAFFQINVRASKLILEDVPEVHEKVEKLLAALDQPIKQVLIQAEIIETAFNEGFNYSIDYVFSRDLFASVIDGLTGVSGVLPTGPGGIEVAPGTTPPQGGGLPGQPPPFGGVPFSGRRGASVDRGDLGFLDFRREFPIGRVSGSGIDTRILTKNAYITLQAAMSDSRTRVLQQPSVLVENQKLVSLNIGQEVPYFTGGSVYGGSTIGQNGQIIQQAGQPVQQRLKVGLLLDITPVISNNGLVELEISLSNDTPVFDEIQFAGQTYTGVGSNTQQIDTTLVIPSGETRVIGGLVNDRKSETRSGVPGLVKIPVLGPLLFGSYNRPAADNGRRNLLIFLTPTIVEEHPRSPAKYKGRAFEQEDLAFLSPPDGTLTDVDIEPAALDLELPPDLPGKAPYSPVEIPAASEGLASAAPLAPSLTREPVATELPQVPAPALEPPQEGEAPQALDPVPPASEAAGTVELRRIRIPDRPEDETESEPAVSRIPAPAGNINVGVGIAPPSSSPGGPAPGAQPGAQPGGTVVPGAGTVAVPVTTPGVVVPAGGVASTPLATPAAVTVTPIPGTTPISTPVAPPQPETRF